MDTAPSPNKGTVEKDGGERTDDHDDGSIKDEEEGSRRWRRRGTPILMSQKVFTALSTESPLAYNDPYLSIYL